MKSWTVTCWVVVSFLTASPSVAQAQQVEPLALEVTAQNTTLRVGKSVQLTVIAKFPDGTTKDVTAARHGTRYETGNQFLGKPPLVTVDPNGLVTAVSSKEGRFITSEEMLVVYRSKAAFIRLRILPWDALEVSAAKTTLRVGETVQLKVVQELPDGSERDLTSASTGTVYRPSNPRQVVVEVNENGLVRAVSTLGRTKKWVMISVSNGSLVGVIGLTILPEGSKNGGGRP